MVSQSLFSFFVLALAGQRVRELLKSERHRRWLLRQGGREHSSGHFPFMVALHAGWLLAMLIEIWLLTRSYHMVLTIFAGATFILGQSLRILAMQELGARWTVRIVTIPGLMPVTSGIFRYMRHPNYFGVVLEMASAPLLHGAVITSVTFSVLNLIMLRVRIREEEKALDQDNHYYAVLLEKRKC